MSIFNKLLSEALTKLIPPSELYYKSPKSIPFIYLQNQIFYGKPGQNHPQLVANHINPLERLLSITEAAAGYNQLLQTIMNQPQSAKRPKPRQKPPPPPQLDSRINDVFWRITAETTTSLVGRVGMFNGRRIISIWPNDKQNFESLIKPCVDKLMMDDLVDFDSEIHSPYAKNGLKVIDLEMQQQFQDMSPAEKSELENERALHLLSGPEKKAALQRLGYAGGEKNKWQKSLEDTHQVSPGQKWWAMHSEDRS